MRIVSLVGMVAAALIVANQDARAQGLFGVLQDVAATPVSAAQDLAGATVTAAGSGAATTAQVGTEAVYLAGDGTETIYRYHPGARLGRKAGYLPEGKLGLLPSHTTEPQEARANLYGADPGRGTDARSTGADPEPRRSNDTAAPSSTVHKADRSVAASRRATARPRRSRGLVSRLFQFGRR